MNALHASSPIFVVTHIQGVKIERRYWDISKSGLGNLSSLEGIVENLNSMDSMSVQSNEVSFFCSNARTLCNQCICPLLPEDSDKILRFRTYRLLSSRHRSDTLLA